MTIRTYKGRTIFALFIVTVVLIFLGFLSGLATNGIVGALSIMGIAIIFFGLIWGIVAGIWALVAWIARAPGPRTEEEDEDGAVV